MSHILGWVYPELVAFREPERRSALREARATPFDAIELIGIATVLVLVTALTRYGLRDADLAGRIGAALLNFIIAVPLLAIGIGPFWIRRARRGLRAQLVRRKSSEQR